MADPGRYVTTDELRAELPFDAADFPVQDTTQFDSALSRALGAASDSVETWGETVYQTETTMTALSRPVHVPDDDLPLPKRPIQSVQSIEADGTALVEDDDYVVYETHLGLLDDAALREWPTDRASVSIEWTYGYESVPEPVREAIIRLARNALDQIETDGYATDDEGWSFRPPAAIKNECAVIVSNHDAPSYYSGAMIV